MKKSLFFFLILCLSACNGEDQSNKRSICVYTRSPANVDTMSLYKNSAKIEVRAFIEDFGEFTKLFRAEEGKPPVDVDRDCNENIFLNTAQKDSLFHLLTGFKVTPGRMTVEACYSPRHKILFYDSRDSVTGYIDICFSCSQCRSNLQEFQIVCNDQLDYYKAFLKWCGITIGFGEN